MVRLKNTTGLDGAELLVLFDQEKSSIWLLRRIPEGVTILLPNGRFRELEKNIKKIYISFEEVCPSVKAAKNKRLLIVRCMKINHIAIAYDYTLDLSRFHLLAKLLPLSGNIAASYSHRLEVINRDF